jgi:hypothetical protein
MVWGTCAARGLMVRLLQGVDPIRGRQRLGCTMFWQNAATHHLTILGSRGDCAVQLFVAVDGRESVPFYPQILFL